MCGASSCAFSEQKNNRSSGTTHLEFSNLDELRQAAATCNDGSITLTWESADGATHKDYLLEQSSNPQFKKTILRYQGSDTGSVITGLPEGSHYFRVRHVDGLPNTSSSILEVKVDFFPKHKLTWLLSIGGVVMIATLSTIIYGYRKTIKESTAQRAREERCYDD